MTNTRFTEEEAEKAGYDCGKNGATPINCHFQFFATKEMTKAWEQGKRKAENEKSNEW